MIKRFAVSMLCLVLCCSFLPSALAGEAAGDAEAEARRRVVEYAEQIYNYTWEIPEDQYLLIYNRNYYPETNGFRIVFTAPAWPPFVVSGTVRGVPYTLSSYGNGRETTFAEYKDMTLDQRLEIANIYQYASYGTRISARYGMSCATFLTECMRQGFDEDNAPPIMHGVVSFLNDVRWKQYMTFGKRGAADYPDMQPGDFLRRDGHVMLMVENDPEHQRMRIMNQTPPDYAVKNCENLTDVTVTLYYKGKPTTLQAKRLCMACDACLQTTTGTNCCWIDYDTLLEEEYMAVFVKY